MQSTTGVQHQTLVESPAILGTLDEFRVYLASRKMRERASATYCREVVAFAAWLGDDTLVLHLTEVVCERYQAHMSRLASATISKKLSALRAYARFCVRRGFLAADPTSNLEWPRRRKRLPRPLKAHELAQLEAILARSAPVLDRKARRLWFRNRRIVLLMLYAGLRRAEVAGLVWDAVYLAEGFLIVSEETAKGGTERSVPLHPRLHADLATTPESEQRGAVAGHPDGRCLSHKSIGHIFERWLADAGLRISAHRLRHTNATEQLRAGASLRDIQATLGHADIRTTEGYVALLPERQRAAIGRLPERFGTEA